MEYPHVTKIVRTPRKHTILSLKLSLKSSSTFMHAVMPVVTQYSKTHSMHQLLSATFYARWFKIATIKPKDTRAQHGTNTREHRDYSRIHGSGQHGHHGQG